MYCTTIPIALCTLCAAPCLSLFESSKCVVSFEIAIKILHFIAGILIWRTVVAFLSSETIQSLAVVWQCSTSFSNRYNFVLMGRRQSGGHANAPPKEQKRVSARASTCQGTGEHVVSPIFGGSEFASPFLARSSACRQFWRERGLRSTTVLAGSGPDRARELFECQLYVGACT